MEYGTLFASRDPVAIDATAVRLIDENRRANRMSSVHPLSTYIETAESLGLGKAHESDIEMVRVGVSSPPH